MPALNHIHSYVRMNKKYMKCNDPKCTHYMAKEFLKDKESLCSVCHKNTLTLDYEAFRRANPRCFECSDTKEARIARERTKILKNLGVDFDAILEVKET